MRSTYHLEVVYTYYTSNEVQLGTSNAVQLLRRSLLIPGIQYRVYTYKKGTGTRALVGHWNVVLST